MRWPEFGLTLFATEAQAAAFGTFSQVDAVTDFVAARTEALLHLLGFFGSFTLCDY
jgi:hypothetical protein